MLHSLKIQNYALIDEIEIQFGAHLNVITGETGAGKSILLGALSLILGKRADTSVLFHPSKKCIVEGYFILNSEKYLSFFTNNELDFDENTIIRREIAVNGKSRAFINDTPVTLTQLSELTETIIDIHAQHQTLQLNNPAFQLNILDAVGALQEAVSVFKFEYRKYRELEKNVRELEELEKQSKADLDYLRFQLNEIAPLQLNTESDSLLEEEYLTLSHAEKIRENLQEVIYQLDGHELSVLQSFRQALKHLQEISSFNPRINRFYESLHSAEIEIRDLIPEISSFRDETEVDQQRIDILLERINEINRLLTKHQLTNVENLISFANETKEKIKTINSLESDIDHKKTELMDRYKSLQEKALHISEIRVRTTSVAEKQLLELLRSVGMKNAKLHFKLTQLKDQLKVDGMDEIDILFSTNPGIDLQSVSKVASGGELSRLMLCIKYLMAGTTVLPTLIFDEIDLGISGEIAFHVGKLLSEMATHHQIIAITHLPQVASYGQDHFRVYKTSAENKTRTQIAKLNTEGRIEELSKMIGGENPSKTAIESAKELLELRVIGL